MKYSFLSSYSDKISDKMFFEHVNSVLKSVLLSIFAVAGNIILVFFVRKSNVPVFMDTIFTVAVTFYAGLIPGLLAAVMYNPAITLIDCFMADSEIYVFDFLYSICGMVIVLITWQISRNKEEFLFSKAVTVLYLTIIACASSFVSSICASVLDTVIRPLFAKSAGFSPIDSVQVQLQRENVSTFLSFLLPRIPISLFDRLLSTFAGYGVSLVMVKIASGRYKKSREENLANV